MRYLFLSFLFFIPNWLLASIPMVHNTPAGVELRNDLVSIVLSERAELVSCKELATGIDIASHDKGKIASLTTKDGRTVEADRLTLQGDIITFGIGQYEVKVRVEAFDKYFTWEVVNGNLSGVDLLTFLDLKFKYDFKAENVFLATATAMTLQTDPVYFPSGENKAIRGRCTSLTGIKGAKLAVIACKKDELRNVLIKVFDTIQKGDIPKTRAGGPYSLDFKDNKRDCVIINGETDPLTVFDRVDFYKSIGIDQINFLRGSKTFMSGQFTFPMLGSASAFKKQVADLLYERGITAIMHTYSFYVSYGANELLSNPKWQQQLEYRETFTLSKDLSETATSVSVSGDKSAIKNDATYWNAHTPFVLIDEELVRYSLDKNGFATLQRGQCGTKAAWHRAGAEVRVIGGKYNCIAPQIGSELYYEIARRLAKAYNEGGFRGIYFDAFDGLETHVNHQGLKDYYWYYGAAFVNEVLKYCEGSPMVEYAWQFPSIWSARGRCGAWDTPNRGYKNFADDHLIYNKDYMGRHLVTTLGWYDFYPVPKAKEPANFSVKYMFADDVDYVGVQAVAYDQNMVYEGLKEEDLERIPGMRRNLELYAQYNQLRKDGYFEDKVLSVLRRGVHEYKLSRKSGRWGFLEAEYCKMKLRDIGVDELRGFNPFKKQKPFIRLENMFTSDCNSSIMLMFFDEAQEFKGQKCEKSFSSPVDMSKNLGLRVVVKGNGSQSKDAICIRLSSMDPDTGFGDYVIKLDFEGWRDILLTNLDNAENPKLKFSGLIDNLYKVHKKPVDFTKIRSMQVYGTGECKGVRIRTIEAVPLISNTLTNPSVTIGEALVTFDGVLQSGEYIEYNVGDKVASIYDSVGKSRTIGVTTKGRFRVPNGDFSAKVFGDAEHDNMPTEVCLTFGLYGKFIHN